MPTIWPAAAKPPRLRCAAGTHEMSSGRDTGLPSPWSIRSIISAHAVDAVSGNRLYCVAARRNRLYTPDTAKVHSRALTGHWPSPNNLSVGHRYNAAALARTTRPDRHGKRVGSDSSLSVG